MKRGLRLGLAVCASVGLCLSSLPCSADTLPLSASEMARIRGGGGTAWPGEMWLDPSGVTVGACIPFMGCTYYPGPGQPPIQGYCICDPYNISHPGGSGGTKYKAGPCYGQTAQMYSDSACTTYFTSKSCTPLTSTQVQPSG